MQDIERYGLITLLFLVASVTAVFLWGGHDSAGDILPAQVASAQPRAAVGGTPLESQRTTSRVPTSPRGPQERGGSQDRIGSKGERQSRGTAERDAGQAQVNAQQAAEAEAARQRLADERRRERLEHERAVAAAAEAQAKAAAEAEAERQRQSELLAEKRALPGADVQRQQKPLLREITVAEGDSFWKIAERELGNGLRADKIAAVNPDVNPKRLTVGQKLLIPTAAGLAAHEQAQAQARQTVAEQPSTPAAKPTTVAAASGDAGSYRVREGDSAWIVAKRLCGRGSRWAELAPLNPTINLESLKVGQRLQVPADWTRAQRSTTVAQNTSSSSSSRSLVR